MSCTELLLVLAAAAAVYGAGYWASRNKNLAEKLGFSIEGLAVVLRCGRFHERVQRVGARYARVMRAFGDIGAVAGSALGLVGFAYLHMNLLQLAARSPAASPVIPLVPGWTIGLDALPYFVVAVAVALVPHELAHALVAAAESIPVKSVGAFLLLLFPGGFAELDEEELERRPARVKARVLSAGSLANLLTFLLLLLTAQLLVKPIGVRIVGTLEGYPAHGVLEPGDLVVGVSGVSVLTLEDFSKFLSRYNPGDTVELDVLRKGAALKVQVKLASRPDNPAMPMLGVMIEQAFSNEAYYGVLWWSIVLTGSVALLNMLPIYPLDGGRLLAAALTRLGQKTRKNLVVGVSAYTTILLLLNIVLSMAPIP
uniref:PDZ domain-containing protein n=1 Tax=Thermofilum pendens TaxID=2269 RepID=A0A7C3WUB5_THEPE